ncbi:hypothetical protein D3874_23655 [Oleomonas cavernae]|uniref:Uncharacterized protein n=1 Tax=Oleomonas cavernae TaxID=2320859 RepID=A0A418WHT1_9PROT|nr:hypothetical protein [Oleomonas cavernae]RJF89596.1 hypothetical protein D3874_23655 [Oleomonas cavernae]
MTTPPRWRAFVFTATMAALLLALARRFGIEGHEASVIDLAARAIDRQVAAYPPLPVLLTALLDNLTAGLLPSAADVLSVLIAGTAGPLSAAGQRSGHRGWPWPWSRGPASCCFACSCYALGWPCSSFGRETAPCH